MPFGLTNAPCTFKSLMNHVFQDLSRKSVLVFFEDILVYNKTWEEHLQHLSEVFLILQQQQLYLKLSKCTFGATMMEYLGHFISVEGVSTDPKKIAVIRDWPVPTTQKQLRSFLGLENYYIRFIRGYSSIARPLSQPLKKRGFVGNLTPLTRFQTLRQPSAPHQSWLSLTLISLSSSSQMHTTMALVRYLCMVNTLSASSVEPSIQDTITFLSMKKS